MPDSLGSKSEDRADNRQTQSTETRSVGAVKQPSKRKVRISNFSSSMFGLLLLIPPVRTSEVAPPAESLQLIIVSGSGRHKQMIASKPGWRHGTEHKGLRNRKREKER